MNKNVIQVTVLKKKMAQCGQRFRLGLLDPNDIIETSTAKEAGSQVKCK
jgi:hypothetical protein